jgi:hypothetical protein
MWLMSVVLGAISVYGLYQIVQAIVGNADIIVPCPAPDVVTKSHEVLASNKSAGMVFVVAGDTMLQKVVDGAMTTIGSTVALILMGRWKHGKQ